MAAVNYIIMSSPRTGSSMLCAALAGSSLAGNPTEFMHQAGLEGNGHPETDMQSLNAYMQKLIDENTTPNGVFGMKMHFNQFDAIFSDEGIGLRNGLEFLGRFQKFILIYRKDKILQSISELLASEANIWNSEDESLKCSLGREFNSLDTLKITQIMNRQIYETIAWRSVLYKIGHNFHSMTYEDLVGQPDKEFQALTDYLGIEELKNVALSTKTVKITDSAAALKMKNDYLRALGC